MPRATAAVPRNKRKKKIFKAAKGYFGGRKNLYKTAKDAVEKGWEHAYRDRRKKKRNFRRLWIARINAGVREHGLSYSRFINGLKESGSEGRLTLSVAPSTRALRGVHPWSPSSWARKGQIGFRLMFYPEDKAKQEIS